MHMNHEGSPLPQEITVVLPSKILDQHVYNLALQIQTIHTVKEVLIVTKDQGTESARERIRIIGSRYPGPGGAWCTGVRSARCEIVWLVSGNIEAHISSLENLENVFSHLAHYDFLQGDYSATSEQTLLAKIESYGDQLRLRSRVRQIIDFRNLCVKRSPFLQLVDKYFAHGYACDAELEIALACEHIETPVISLPIVYNRYPSTFVAAAIRRFRHGAYVSQIVRECAGFALDRYKPSLFKRLARYYQYSKNYPGSLGGKVLAALLYAAFLLGIIVEDIFHGTALRWYPKTMVQAEYLKP